MDEEDERRAALEAALGAIEDSGHDWDDPADWVRRQRSDERRTG